MHFPENPSEMTPEWAEVILHDYYADYDVLDAQGQFSSAEINEMLAMKFFKNSTHTLEDIRNLAQAAKPAESSAAIEKVADAAAKLVEPQQASLFDFQPSETTEALRPKTALEMNYEDFEAAWAIQTAGGAKPETIEFETVKYGVRTNFGFSYVLAKAIMIPPSRSVRTMALRHHIYKDEPEN